MLHTTWALAALASALKVTHEYGLEGTKSAPIFGDALGSSIVGGGARRRASSSFGGASPLDGLSSTFHEVQSAAEKNSGVQSRGAPGPPSFYESSERSGATSPDKDGKNIQVTGELTIPAQGISSAPANGGNRTINVGIEITIEDAVQKPVAPKEHAEPVQVATDSDGIAARVEAASPTNDLPPRLARQETAATLPKEPSAPVPPASPPLPDSPPGPTLYDRFEETYKQMMDRQKQDKFSGPMEDEERVLKSMWDANAPTGHIDDRKQLLDLLLILGQPPVNEGEDLDQTFKEWDTKGDGVIDYEEYLNEMITRVKDGHPLNMS